MFSFWRAEGFSCSLDVILVIKTLEPDPDSLEMLDPDSMNPDPQHRTAVYAMMHSCSRIMMNVRPVFVTSTFYDEFLLFLEKFSPLFFLFVNFFMVHGSFTFSLLTCTALVFTPRII
jgi:hypothetical protein